MNKLLKNTLIYFFGNIFSKLVAFILLPIYTKYLLPEQYGTYDSLVTYASLISSVVFFDIWVGVLRLLSDKNRDSDNKNKIISNGIMIFLTSALVYSGICFILHLFNFKLIFYIWLYGLMNCIQCLFGYVCRGYEKNLLYAVSGVVCALVNLILNVLLIVIFHLGIEAIFYSFAASIIIQIAIIEIKLHIIFNFRFTDLSKEILRNLCAFSLPLCLNSACNWLMTGYNRIVIINKLGEEFNGYYAVGSKFSVAITLIASCFLMAWQELAYKKNENNEENTLFYSNAIYNFLKILLLLSTVLMPAIYLAFPIIIDSQYNAALEIIPLYLLATIFIVSTTFVGNIIGAYKKTTVMFFAAVVSCVANVVLVNVLVPRIGIIGAVISMLIGYTLDFIIRYLYIRYKYNIKFNYFKILLCIFLFGISYLIFKIDSTLLNAITILLFCLIVFAVYRKDIKKLIVSYKKRRN